MDDVARRTFLKGGAALFAAMALDGASARGRTGFFSRIACPIGLQLYTLGGEIRSDLDAAFAAVAAIGYRDIEISSLYGRAPADIRAAAARAGLSISSLHLFGTKIGADPSLADQADTIAETVAALGASSAVLPIALFPNGFTMRKGVPFREALVASLATDNGDCWKRTAALLNARAAALKPFGVRVGYHNHNIEFASVGATTGWDILLAECDPGLVDFQIDVGWVAAAGRDPAALLRSLKGRVAQIHVKDLAASTPVNFALAMNPAEVGAGRLDWTNILNAAHAAGVRHFYVEQEPPFALPRLEAARRSYEYLSALKA